jgi:hypothetical protein
VRIPKPEEKKPHRVAISVGNGSQAEAEAPAIEGTEQSS